MKHIILLLLLTFSVSIVTTAQDEPTLVDDQLVVQLRADITPASFFQTFFKEHNLPKIQYTRTVSSHRLSILVFDPMLTDGDRLQALLEEESAVNFAAFNQRATIHTTPNDPDYGEQWHLEMIDAPEVWDFTMGGLTPLGDTIVIANLESCETAHEDLKENIWRNYGEIQGNGIDDDDNGYTDDYEGYYVNTRNDQHTASSHGSRVCGIMGARGDNGIGISGVNWETKMMVVSHSYLVSDIIEACEYVYEQRLAYNDSDGARGAFVVATNASFGFDGSFPEDNPMFGIWCNVMADMGQAGILSVVATSNAVINVDTVGDVAVHCSTNHIVVVTDTDRQDELVAAFSGNGTLVDLSSPSGSGALSTAPDNSYQTLSGTSGAAPHVTGAIGLLYSAPCTGFAELAKRDPSQAASLMKDFILKGTAAIPSLDGKTVSGGRLNIEGSLNFLQEFCGGAAAPLNITVIQPNPVRIGAEVRVSFQTPDEAVYRIRVTDALGRVVASSEQMSTTFGSNIVRIETDNFAVGVYFFTVENNRATETEAFLIW